VDPRFFANMKLQIVYGDNDKSFRTCHASYQLFVAEFRISRCSQPPPRC
jgi:hypothetical protein